VAFGRSIAPRHTNASSNRLRSPQLLNNDLSLDDEESIDFGEAISGEHRGHAQHASESECAALNFETLRLVPL